MRRVVPKLKKRMVLGVTLLMVLTTIGVTIGVNRKSPDVLGVNASTSNYCAPSSVTTTTPDTVYDGYFNQKTGPGWVGGDSTYRAKLPDGRIVWDFSDTLIGTASISGKASFTGMPHNTLLIGSDSALITNVGGTYTSPHSLIPDTTYNGQPAWYWVGVTMVENKQLLVFANEITTGNVFGVVTGNSVIAVFSTPAAPALPVFQKIIPLYSDPQMQWGIGHTYDNTYNYIYGTTNHQMKIARVPRGKTTTLSSWQFWNGTSWVSGEQNSVVVNTTQAEAVSPLPSNWGKGYIAVSVSGFPGLSLQEQFACAPQGPWSAPQQMYTIPETNGEYPYEIAYIPNIVGYRPNGNSSLRVSYNINYTGSNGFGTLAQNINMYRPRFVDIQSNGPVTGYKGICAEDSNGTTTDGNPIDIWTCNSTAQQQWSYHSDNSLQVLGKCLSVPYGKTANGTQVVLSTCTDSNYQKWQQKTNGELLNVGSNKCLDDTNYNTTNGTPLAIWSCKDSANQQWKLP